MQGAGALIRPQCLEVVGLESGRFPRARCDHVNRQVRGLLGYFEGELRPLLELEGDDLLCPDKLALLQVGEYLCVGVCLCRLDGL